MRLPLEDLHNFLRSRRSIRRFLSDPVPEEVVGRILLSAGSAPSAHNRQPWKVAVVEKETSREGLADEMGKEFQADLRADGLSSEEVERQVNRSRQRILHAPVVFMLCLDLEAVDTYPGTKRSRAEELMGVQSMALFGGTLLLAAHAEGLGGVWMCAPLFAGAAVQDALNLPQTWDPQGMILIGYPAKIPDPRIKKTVGDFVVYR